MSTPRTPTASPSIRSSLRPGMVWWQKLAIAAAILLLTLLLALGVALAVIYHLWNAPPPHWQQYQTWLQTTTPQERQALATRLEKRMLARLAELPTTPRRTSVSGTGASPNSGSAFTLDFQLTVEEANAWLEQRLPQVLANQDIHLPEDIQGLMVAVEANRLLLSFRFQAGRMDQVFTVVTQPRFVTGAQGAAQMQFNLRSVRGGRMPIPGGLLNKAAQQTDSKGMDKAIESVLTTLRGRAIDARIPCPGDHQRMLRITALNLQEQVLQFQVQLEAQ